jgi:hypothetical protein
MGKKHEDSVKEIQDTVDRLIERHGQKLILSLSMAIMDDNHEPQTLQVLQWGIRDAMLLLLRDTLEMTEDEGDFIGSEGKPKTIN